MSRSGKVSYIDGPFEEGPHDDWVVLAASWKNKIIRNWDTNCPFLEILSCFLKAAIEPFSYRKRI